MSGRFLLDTNIILDQIKGETPVVRFLEEHRGIKFYISVITRIELLSFHGMTTDEEIKIRGILATTKVLPLNDSVEDEAIRFRSVTRRKVPDSIIAASAIFMGAVLVTNDEKLLNLQYAGLETISI